MSGPLLAGMIACPLCQPDVLWRCSLVTVLQSDSLKIRFLSRTRLSWTTNSSKPYSPHSQSFTVSHESQLRVFHLSLGRASGVLMHGARDACGSFSWGARALSLSLPLSLLLHLAPARDPCPPILNMACMVWQFFVGSAINPTLVWCKIMHHILRLAGLYYFVWVPVRIGTPPSHTP